MKRILVPCDFSKPAVSAYRFALNIAAQSKGVVHVVHVIELPLLNDSVLMPVLNYEEQLFAELRKNAAKQFNNLVEKYSQDIVKVEFKVLFGDVAKMLQGYIRDESIDLVLMGSHGATGMREVFIGSNAEKIVRRSLVPVLVVKDFYKGPVRNIVFPNTLDTERQEDLIMKIKALQNFFKAQLHIVWINTPVNFTADTITRARLQAFATRFMLKDYTINVFNHPSEEKGILEFSNLVKGDLIAMGTNSRKGISHVLNGSLAEDVVNHNKKLVWTYTIKGEN